MKLNTLKTLTLVTMLLVSAGAMAQNTATYIYKLNGGDPGNITVGTVEYQGTSTTGTIKVTPAAGYYLIVENLKVTKTIDGSNAQTRMDFDAPVTVTPTVANADPSGETTYTFDIADTKYDYVITADFGSRTPIMDATVELAAGQTLTYTGEAIKPNLVVTLRGTTLTAGTDYNAYYQDSINAGTGKIMLVGIRKYTGTCGSWDNPAKTYTIEKADINPVVSIADWTYGDEASKPTITGNSGNGNVTYRYKVKDADDGTYSETVPTTAGSYTIQATVEETSNYNGATCTKDFTIKKATVSLSYSANEAEGKIGVAFAAPTLNNPSNVAVTYSSSNTDVATISDEGVVTLVGPGETTITASFAGDENHEAASTSYKLSVVKLEAGLSWTDEGMEYFLGTYWYGPRLNNPNNLPVKYKSSDEKVATIDKDGKVTALAVGDTWIMAIFEGNEMYEPQTVRYGLFVKERYDLLVNDVRVTSDNSKNVLGDGHFFYDENTKQLVVLENTTPVTIESRLKNLTIFLNGSSKLERIFFNNEGKEENTGSLTITTYENIPGSVVLETSNANGVISGFSSLTIDDKSYTYLLDPAEGKYEGGKLVTAEGGVAMSATIGQYLKPLVDGQTVTFPPGKFGIDDFTNKVIDDILFTMVLRPDGSDEDDDFYDPVESAIVLNNLNSTSGVTMLIDNVEKDGLIPGSNEYALQFKGGITFMVPNGEGTITLNLKTEPGYKLMLMIGKSEPKEISQNERGDVQFEYNVEKATYVCVYLVQAAGTRGTRIGKRDRHHGSIYSIKVEPTKVRNMNPLGEVEGYPGNQKPEVVVHSSTGIKEIKVEPTNETSGDDSWYDMQGRKIDKPTKAGIYIQNRKKIVIR